MPTIITNIIWSIIIALVTFILGEISVKAIRHFLDAADNPIASSSLVLNTVRGVIWAIGVSFILGVFDIDASAIFTALGIGGVALSLGLQDTLSNLMGGAQITFMHIVEPGDNIEVDGVEGVVQDITWRQTTIEDALGQTIILPNSTVSSNTVTKLLPATRVVVPFSIPRPTQEQRAGETETMDDLADRLCTIARAAAEKVSPVVDAPFVLFSEITSLGVDGKIIFSVEDADKTAFAADAVIRAIAREVQ